MAGSRLKGLIAQRFDDYVEETVVGQRAWVIVLLFALGLPILTVLLDVAFPALYRRAMLRSVCLFAPSLGSRSYW